MPLVLRVGTHFKREFKFFPPWMEEKLLGIPGYRASWYSLLFVSHFSYFSITFGLSISLIL